ncbi:MAG: hypothetical protein ACTIJ6_02100 [Leucobacter sp.]
MSAIQDPVFQGSVFRNTDPASRAQVGRNTIHNAYAAPNAVEVITTGDWADFTAADATAWCWNLYQYEPHGFAYPASAVHMRRERELESGTIPEGGGYAEKARSYVLRGVTTQQYREARETLESPTFCWTDVRHDR